MCSVRFANMKPSRTNTCLLFALAVLVSCGDDGGSATADAGADTAVDASGDSANTGDGASGDSAVGSLPHSEFWTAYAQAYCANIASCCKTDERDEALNRLVSDFGFDPSEYAGDDGCNALILAFAEKVHGYGINAGLEHGGLVYDESRASSCLESMKTRGCEWFGRGDGDESPPYDEFGFSGCGEPGRNEYGQDVNEFGPYRSTLDAGDECASLTECRSGACVDSETTKVCSCIVDDGAAPGICPSDKICIYPGLCADRYAEGGDCSYDGTYCEQGLVCVDFKCAAPKAENDACTSQQPCGDGLFCRPTEVEGDEGCMTSQGTDGDPCSEPWYSNIPSDCADGFFCSDLEHVCRPRLTNGTNCDDEFYGCADGLACRPVTAGNAEPKTCQPAGKEGEGCASSDEPGQCEDGLKCFAQTDTCEIYPSAKGGPCDGPHSDCEYGLLCQGSICAEPTVDAGRYRCDGV